MPAHSHQGLIPALAGTTRTSGLTRSAPWAHPRVGGDDTAARIANLYDKGSSPRWRGRRSYALVKRRSGGAHPRVGGDDRSPSPNTARNLGSSPRWRGRPDDPDVAVRDRGLIPALAGTTTWAWPSARGARAHPRVGGDDCAIAHGVAQAVGSSPRWRGRRPGARLRHHRRRLIPALAGTTSASTSSPTKPRAHPRVGGDDRPHTPQARRTPGSPPRWRGRQAHRVVLLGPVGLIPALAGTTRRDRSPACSCTAHPRVGGDDDVDIDRMTEA